MRSAARQECPTMVTAPHQPLLHLVTDRQGRTGLSFYWAQGWAWCLSALPGYLQQAGWGAGREKVMGRGRSGGVRLIKARYPFKRMLYFVKWSKCWVAMGIASLMAPRAQTSLQILVDKRVT
ncbi:hypothetical protein NDU88_000509 [Pleurodeles waltl]|uniref:Uncharacterized protein n=1 Tax=Pleurodeles waltl TaxID=8319 RepID=A0AAV7MH27_PLEWA|nr:hypothetical protein NDU88_000509 [Pleurodeles waltl]